MKTFRSNTNRTWIAFASFSPERMQLKQDICLLSWQPRFSPQDLEMGWNSLAAYLTVLIAIVTMIWVVNYSCATTTKQVFFFFWDQQFITQGMMADCAYRRIYTWQYPNPNPFYVVTHHKGNTKESNPQPQVGGWCNSCEWGALFTYTTMLP